MEKHVYVLSKKSLKIKYIVCLSYCSIAVKKYCDQDNSIKEMFNWEPAYSFRVLVFDHQCWEAGRHVVGAVSESFISRSMASR